MTCCQDTQIPDVLITPNDRQNTGMTLILAKTHTHCIHTTARHIYSENDKFDILHSVIYPGLKNCPNWLYDVFFWLV